jgi:WD40 repeat protein
VFSPDWRVLATAYNSTVKLWDVASGHELKTLAGHSLNIRAMAFSPHGRTLASSAGDLTIKLLWDVETGRDVRTSGAPPAMIGWHSALTARPGSGGADNRAVGCGNRRRASNTSGRLRQQACLFQS